ncbi:MAG TPA: glycosyl hydrolase 115 family protein, partial [Candidatus Acidoferrum sp.]|nr:glycosyl hydrolase 115 family protein [Candidatus Acidoferrum sp.]
FELMLRLRLNYLWPAMHACSAEFASVPENYALADKFAIVAGSSHCEPMLCNNVHWNEREKGRWNYSLNRDTIHSYWEDSVKARGADEAVWTIGIRGIHDAGMQTPPTDMPGKINLMTEVFRDQRDLLSQYVTKQWGPVAQCFVPYKEVLPIYDEGLKVPDDVTLVWVDDNFGYIRRLSTPAERSRSGGSGVYWHISYYGGPHSYTWINTTAPAFMWEELHKAWENEARTLWVINVGDIKPMEIGIDYFSRLAWNPDGFPLGAQRAFLGDFAKGNFGAKTARQMTDLLVDFYRLGTVRKPELMERNWALSLTPERAKELEKDYQNLLDRERSLAQAVPPEARDAYTELIGFPARVVGLSGQIFMADRKRQKGEDVAGNEKRISSLGGDLEAQVGNYNTNLAGGKWNRMMPGLVTAGNLMGWNSEVRWPWGELSQQPSNRPAIVPWPALEQNWRDAASANRQTASSAARWSTVEGLGPSGRAVTLQPVELSSSWKEDDVHAPALEFDFKCNGGDAEAWVDFLPVFRLYPGMKLRVAVSVDNGAATAIEVPGSSGAENENGQVRSQGVQDNYVRARVPMPALTAGRHIFKVRAMDPGVGIDRIWLPLQ